MSYVLRALWVSSWSGVLFEPHDRPLWPGGVRLDPDEEDLVLRLLPDFHGLVVPVDGWTVLGFVAGEYSRRELQELQAKLDDGRLDPAAFIAGQVVGLPGIALKQNFPADCPPPRVQFLEPQENIQLPEESAPRLFPNHWLLCLLTPPEKENRYDQCD
ncbi:hypothetical protein D3C84_865110 [compost metagenome]